MKAVTVREARSNLEAVIFTLLVGHPWDKDLAAAIELLVDAKVREALDIERASR